MLLVRYRRDLRARWVACSVLLVIVVASCRACPSFLWLLRSEWALTLRCVCCERKTMLKDMSALPFASPSRRTALAIEWIQSTVIEGDVYPVATDDDAEE